MTEVVSFDGPDGASLQVEVADDAPGLERISRDSGEVVRAGRRLEDALAQARPAIRSVVDSVRALGPDEYEIEFGMKFNAESGVVIAKTAVEGHFMVKVRWTRPGPDRTA
ncbi:CU044_2847 family protein [Streptomyces sp. NPDC004728]|uniref:CU044_2847 family protein n=1 Tax=Streptomyces sp. NPDC004728 TaxID=3154289 RepID=UPI0033BCAFC7